MWMPGFLARWIGRFATQPLPVITPKPSPMAKSTAPDRYKGVYFPDATFPDDPYRKVSVKLNTTVKDVYLPALDRALPGATKGLKTLLIAMTHQEGFDKNANKGKGTRSVRTNNPGNLGNTDTGANNSFPTLEAGIQAQANFIQDIAAGKKKAYPLNKNIDLKPYYSPEIAAHPEYGLPPYTPGYKFVYTGGLKQFLKIYSTGARATNSYVNVLTSFFAINGLTITPESKLADIIALT